MNFHRNLRKTHLAKFKELSEALALQHEAGNLDCIISLTNVP